MLLIQRETPVDIVEDAGGPTTAASGMRGKTSPIASREKADTMQGTGSVIQSPQLRLPSSLTGPTIVM